MFLFMNLLIYLMIVNKSKKLKNREIQKLKIKVLYQKVANLNNKFIMNKNNQYLLKKKNLKSSKLTKKPLKNTKNINDMR